MAGSLDNPRTGTYISLVSSNPRPGETRQDHGGDHLLTLLPGASATAPPVCTCPAAASAHPAAACLPYALLFAASPRAGRGLEGGGNCSIPFDSSDARVAGRRTGAPTFRCRGASTEDRVGRGLARPKVGEPAKLVAPVARMTSPSKTGPINVHERVSYGDCACAATECEARNQLDNMGAAAWRACYNSTLGVNNGETAPGISHRKENGGHWRTWRDLPGMWIFGLEGSPNRPREWWWLQRAQRETGNNQPLPASYCRPRSEPLPVVVRQLQLDQAIREEGTLQGLGALRRGTDDTYPVSTGSRRGNRWQRFTGSCQGISDSCAEIADEYRVTAGAGPASAHLSVAPPAIGGHRRKTAKSMPMRGELAPREQTPGCAARKNTPVAGCDSGRMRVRGDSSPDGDRHPFSTSRPCGPRHRSCDQHLPAHPGHNHGHLPGGLRPGVVQPGFFPTKESVYDGRQAVPPVS